MLFFDKNVDDIECDESILVFNINKEVDSINFKNAIIQSLFIELPQDSIDNREMIINSFFGDCFYGNLVIENDPKLERIIVKSYSLKNLNLLKICNCENVKTIEIGGGSFEYVDKVIIKSSSEVMI